MKPKVVSDSLQPRGLYSPWNSPGQNTGVGSLSLLLDLGNPGIEPRSPALQANSSPAEPQGKPILEWVAIPLLHGIFPIQGSNPELPNCRLILYQLSHKGSPNNPRNITKCGGDLVPKSRSTLCDPMDYTVHEIHQARILEWAAFPFSRGSSQSRD